MKHGTSSICTANSLIFVCRVFDICLPVTGLFSFKKGSQTWHFKVLICTVCHWAILQTLKGLKLQTRTYIRPHWLQWIDLSNVEKSAPAGFRDFLLTIEYCTNMTSFTEESDEIRIHQGWEQFALYQWCCCALAVNGLCVDNIHSTSSLGKCTRCWSYISAPSLNLLWLYKLPNGPLIAL